MRITRQSQIPIKPIAAAAVALAALAVANHLIARRAERRHPPEGAFMTVDGVRLHYTDRGKGAPVVLIHGNAVTGADWNTSGVADLLLAHHRVIIVDRPGFGHSDRPRLTVWTAARQANLIAKALRRLGVERPVVVGHSWGAIVAVALAVQHQAELAGVVLLSGYYFPTARPDVVPTAIGALPGLGDILRYTVSPLLGWLQMPLLKWQMFSPRSIPSRFRADYATAMALRPSQIRATAEDGALMLPSALALQNSYEKLTLPVAILAGEDDRVVWSRRARELADKIPSSTLRILSNVGHMVHYAVPALVAETVDDIERQTCKQPPRLSPPVQRAQAAA